MSFHCFKWQVWGLICLIAVVADYGAPAAARSTNHWSFYPPVRPVPPARASTMFPARNPIDLFVQAGLARDGITPSGEADRVTLIRRLYLDVIGLPPNPEEVERFLADRRPDAYERLVDQLLSSAHYGERWGRWWLDAARYADSNGYSIDAPRSIWKYRDWVVNALNADMPFDEFATEQLAGDLLPHATVEQKIATGFNRNTQINQEGGIDPEQFRVEAVMDRVSTFGTVFLGLTVGCAQCHNHKFDPISQKEYYQLFAFFNNTVEDGHGQSTPGGLLEMPNEFEPFDEVLKQLEETKSDLARFLDGQGGDVADWEKELSDEDRAKLKSIVRDAMALPWVQRSFEQKRAAYVAFRPENPEFKPREARLEKLEKREPKHVTTLVMQERKEPRETHILTKGDFTRPAATVEPDVPAVLHPMRKPSEGLPTRLDLAQWLFAEGNPLTARVIVNRIWQQYFGRGLVETENDFGNQGALPTDPELLDWLACEFMVPTVGTGGSAPPWSLKAIHRLIVTSATYRQNSRVRPDLVTTDPNNYLLARQSRIRLDAEIVRDTALTACGLLSEEIGGPPVYPPQPDGVMNLGQVKRAWNASKGSARYRRALYTHFWRATPHPQLAVFDAPDGFSACTRRLRSNTPLQALTLLNDQQFYEFAEALGRRMEKYSGTDADRMEYGFKLCLARPPSGREKERLAQLLDGSSAGWTTVARVLLNLDETITRE